MILSEAKIILGSSSSTRRAILETIGVSEIRTVHPDIDEKKIGNRNGDPQVLVLTVGKAKSDAILKKLKDNSDLNCDGWLILTGDQVVIHRSRILEKPSTIDEAKSFYRDFSRDDDNDVTTVGSIILTDVVTAKQVAAVEVTKVSFISALSDDELNNLLASDPIDELPLCMHCAGGLMVEHPIVAPHIKIKEGSIDTVLGLGKSCFVKLLEELNQQIKVQ